MRNEYPICCYCVYNSKFADYVDEVCKVIFLGGLGVLRGAYPSF
jgi:hypothetical protein